MVVSMRSTMFGRLEHCFSPFSLLLFFLLVGSEPRHRNLRRIEGAMGCGAASGQGTKVHPEIQPKRGRADLQQVFQAFPEYDVPLPASNRRTESHHSKEATKGRDSKLKPGFDSAAALPTEDPEEAEADWSSWDSAEWRDNHSEKPQPPGRRLHERHVRQLNEFREQLEERPKLLEKMVKRRRSRSP